MLLLPEVLAEAGLETQILLEQQEILQQPLRHKEIAEARVLLDQTIELVVEAVALLLQEQML
jgi:hypothetical protein